MNLVLYRLSRTFRSYWLLGVYTLVLTGCDNSSPKKIHPPGRSSYMAQLDSLTREHLKQPHDSLFSYGNDSLISRLTQILQGAGIDTVLYYRRGCQGCEILETPATRCICNEYETSSYLCWRTKARTFAKELDCCRSHVPVSVSADIFDFYFQHQVVFAAGQKFYTDLAAYNRTHPTKPRFLPPSPIHDAFAEIQLWLPPRKLTIEVRTEEFDSTGSPLLLHYEWKRKQWEWTQLLAKHLP